MNAVSELANLTLTETELANCRPVGGENGRTIRALCPFHGSDNQRSLRLERDTGRFQCFACGAWGYTHESRQQWSAQHQPARSLPLPTRQVSVSPSVRPRAEAAIAHGPRELVQQPVGLVAPAHDLHQLLATYQAALPGSWGEKYLELRHIPLEVAQRCGVGYAPPHSWAHTSRDWRWGRLVFPHTDPDGTLVNLYGRAVGADPKVPKPLRHDHLPGPKGYFNAPFLRNATSVFVCEGPFDALSLMVAGHASAVAIYGVDGWNWARESQRLVFALDADQAGEKWRLLAREGRLRGKDISFLPPSTYGQHKDVSAAWAAGCLTI